MAEPAETYLDAMTGLVGEMQELVRAMSAEQPAGMGVARVVQFAARAMPGAEHAAVSVIDRSQQPRTIAATGDVPRLLDELQYELGEGPCMEVLTQSDIVSSEDLMTDEQWPRFGSRALADTGVRSMVSYRLFLSEKRGGALNLYSAKPQAFDRAAVAIGALFASYASLTLLNDLHQDKIMNLERALESNREIGIAMGILMARQLCTGDEAFSLLRQASQNTHHKLRDIAAYVKETGALPEPRSRR